MVTDSRCRKGYLAYVLWGNLISMPVGGMSLSFCAFGVAERALESDLGEFHFVELWTLTDDDSFSLEL